MAFRVPLPADGAARFPAAFFVAARAVFFGDLRVEDFAAFFADFFFADFFADFFFAAFFFPAFREALLALARFLLLEPLRLFTLVTLVTLAVPRSSWALLARASNPPAMLTQSARLRRLLFARAIATSNGRGGADRRRPQRAPRGRREGADASARVDGATDLQPPDRGERLEIVRQQPACDARER